MRFLVTTFVLAIFFGAYMPSSTAQRRGSGGPRYDVNTEVTVRGTVQEVKQVTPGLGRGALGGTHLLVKTGAETVEVHLGPSWFLADHKLVFAAGDEVQVIGSRVTVGGAEAVLAREIRKGEQVVTLRDAQGFPKWSRRSTS